MWLIWPFRPEDTVIARCAHIPDHQAEQTVLRPAWRLSLWPLLLLSSRPPGISYRFLREDPGLI
jgi:hypothetical protein